MDAAQKLGVDQRFELMPSPYSYWLSKRAASTKSVTPSTFGNGIGNAP